MQLNATARDAEGNVLERRTFGWATGDMAIATVSPTGLVTGLAPGEVEIRASAGGVTGGLGITVSPAPPRTINVTTVAGFRTALNGVLPGDSILLAAGTYTLTSELTISRSGTASQPITIQGGGAANTIIDVNQTGVSLTASYVHLRKMRLTDHGLSGLWLHGATYNVLDSLELDHSLQWTLKFQDGSHHNIVQNSWFHDTGNSSIPAYGEAIYVGNSGNTGFPLQTTNTDNTIYSNRFGPDVRSQAIDIKYGSDRTVFRKNVVDGAGTVWAPTEGSAGLVDVIASYTTIDSNVMQFGSPNGVRYFAPQIGTMAGNVASHNTIDLQNIHNATVLHYGFNLTVNTDSPERVTIKCSNVVTNGSFSNVTCVP